MANKNEFRMYLDEAARKATEEYAATRTDEQLAQDIKEARSIAFEKAEAVQERMQTVGDTLVSAMPLNEAGPYYIEARAADPTRGSYDRVAIQFVVMSYDAEDEGRYEFGTEFSVEWNFSQFFNEELNGKPQLQKGTIGSHGLQNPQHLLADVGFGYLAQRVLRGGLEGYYFDPIDTTLAEAFSILESVSMLAHEARIFENEKDRREREAKDREICTVAESIFANSTYHDPKTGRAFFIKKAGPKQITIELRDPSGRRVEGFNETRMEFARRITNSKLELIDE
jgi:hypothetical protein